MKYLVQYIYKTSGWTLPEVREFNGDMEAVTWRKKQLRAADEAFAVCSNAGIDLGEATLLDISVKRYV